jgi:sulfatase maturation enzyme AslB (radical SAM superfamily)
LHLDGSIDIISNSRIAGWVWNSHNPGQRLEVYLRQEDKELACFNASHYRQDLEASGIGDGCYSFDVRLRPSLPDKLLNSVTAEVKGTGHFISIASTAIQPDQKDCQLNVWNFRKLSEQPPSRFGAIRFDPNNDCNLRCVYCHNDRSSELIETDQFRRFIQHNVISTDYFQVGCIMEPTLDSRLCDLMLMVADSPAKPKLTFVLQTNGILLHRHDPQKMKEAGLTQLQVSLDTADPGTQKILRSGMSLQKVLRNVARFRESCPRIDITFVATVTSQNISMMDGLIDLGLNMGVHNFVFREVFYYPDNSIVDHARMPALLLKENDFASMKHRLLEKFGVKANLIFADQEFLEFSTQKMASDSLRDRPSKIGLKVP